MPTHPAVSSTTLEQALRNSLAQRAQLNGSMGELEALALRIGLIQNTHQPRLHDPQLMLFAADHGLAAQGPLPQFASSTSECVNHLLRGEMFASIFAKAQGIEWWVTDAGMVEQPTLHPRLLARKQMHGTQDARLTAAMSTAQAQSAIQAGMEIGDALHGNVVACACIGQGANESAALVLSQLTGTDLVGLLRLPPSQSQTHIQAPWVTPLMQALERHRAASEPLDVLAALGGADIAMLVGLMLVGANKRNVIIVDGLPALAALMIATRINPSLTECCIFSRSHNHPSIDRALALFNCTALLELGMDCPDGTGTSLIWPMLVSATALLNDPAG